jgi:hypothetical protein
MWLTFNGPAWLPALIVLVFIGIKIRADCCPYKRTPFDYALALFLIMTRVGVWAAYNRETALEKFWILLLALMVFYAITSQPRQNPGD